MDFKACFDAYSHQSDRIKADEGRCAASIGIGLGPGIGVQKGLL